MHSSITHLLDYHQRLRQTFDLIDPASFAALSDAFQHCLDTDHAIFICGNGGSGATASHFVCDIVKGVSYGQQQRFRMFCLNDNRATFEAYANDVGYETVFSEPLRNFARPGDLLVAISGSGNSKNVIQAIETAHQIGVNTFGLSGYSGGKLRQLAQTCLHVPIHDMQIVEDLHAHILHCLMQDLVRRSGRTPCSC